MKTQMYYTVIVQTYRAYGGTGRWKTQRNYFEDAEGPAGLKVGDTFETAADKAARDPSNSYSRLHEVVA